MVFVLETAGAQLCVAVALGWEQVLKLLENGVCFHTAAVPALSEAFGCCLQPYFSKSLLRTHT